MLTDSFYLCSMQKNEIHKVLVIQTASIGDVILVTPVLEKLHHFYPGIHIDLLIKQGFESLFEGHPFIHQLLLWDKKKDKYKHLWHLLKEIRSERYDLVVNVQRFLSTGFLTVFSGASQTVGFDKNPLSYFYSTRIRHSIGDKKSVLHETDRNLSLIKHLTDSKSQTPKLYPTPKDIAKMSQYKTNPYICIAPASLWFTKQFPADKWIEFLQNVPSGIFVYLLGSAADEALCSHILLSSEHPNCINFAGKLSLLESAALMRDAQMNYVNDSAPMHLCSSVNARMTAIYCSTVPSFGFGPLADDALVVETTEKLDCRPCGLHGHKTCPEGHFKCAHTIDINQLAVRL
ncbi:MAG: heptosyltransferase II [Bacteroidetes bacterium]|nr:MAG: heptosyltransferase II [Bacteroidota bacterium]